MPSTTKRVLCVDDDKDLCELITTWLNLEGFETVTACDAAEALELVSRESFALIILDQKSPAGGVLELCRTLKDRAASTPILLCSGNPFEPGRAQAAEAGARELLVHDGDMSKLVKAVRRLTSDGAG